MVNSHGEPPEISSVPFSDQKPGTVLFTNKDDYRKYMQKESGIFALDDFGFRGWRLLQQEDPEAVAIIRQNLYGLYKTTAETTFPNLSEEQGEALKTCVVGLGEQLVRFIAHHHFEENFPGELVNQSIGALFGILGRPDVVIPERQGDIPTTISPELRIYIQRHPEISHLAPILPIMESAWKEQLKTYIPGAYQKTSEVFYGSLGEYLEQTASETTGDTEEERRRKNVITEYLFEKKFLPKKGLRILDAGSGSGNRILRPFLTYVRDTHDVRSQVIAVDLLPYPQPSDHAWTQIQEDFSSPDFPEKILTQSGRKKISLITADWSPLWDTPGVDQQQTLQNFSSILTDGGIIILDGAMGYEEEKHAYQKNHPGETGYTIERSFSTQSGDQAKKPFEITPSEDLIARAGTAGLQLLISLEGEIIPGVPMQWMTGKGRERCTLIFRKAGEPHLTADQILVGESSV